MSAHPAITTLSTQPAPSVTARGQRTLAPGHLLLDGASIAGWHPPARSAWHARSHSTRQIKQSASWLLQRCMHEVQCKLLTIGAHVHHDHFGVVLLAAGQLPVLYAPQQLLHSIA